MGRILFLLLLGGMTCEDVLLPVQTGPTPSPAGKISKISSSQIESAFQQAQVNAKNRTDLENLLPSIGGIIPKDSTSSVARHQRFAAIDPKVIKICENQILFEQASNVLVNALNLTNNQRKFGLGSVKLPNGSPKAKEVIQACQDLFQVGTCNPTDKFRTADGSCNNLNNPLWGKSFTCFAHLVPPGYADGLSTPRVATSGKPLPNPRLISTIVHDDLEVPNNNYTLMTMQWAQFIDHDLTLTPMTRAGSSMNMIECCPLNSGQQRHPECFPIAIPSDDSFYAPLNQTCINFVRSATCDSDCKLGPRRQTNQLTGVIDASNIYGNEKNTTDSLRKFSGGLMKVQETNFGELLPPSNNPSNDQCSNPENDSICFQAGDERANEQPALTCMHTIWLRQHNRIAKELQAIHPEASDEEIFQESRRIVGAQLQMITYNELLPVVLGPDYMDFYDLTALTHGNTKYDADTELKMFSEFSTAAYRFGHSLLQNDFKEIIEGGKTTGILELKDNFFFPFTLFEGKLDPILRGLFMSSAQQFDRHLVKAVTNHLYKPQGDPFGMDLAALNVQRGRDHGNNGYTTYIKYCFNIRIKKFSDLVQFMSDTNWQLLMKTYKHVDDIDLFTGGVAEIFLPGAVVGPTFGCIIGQQFNHLKFGDRFYFEHSGQAGSFTYDQLREIRKTTLAKVLCENSDGIVKIAHYVFLPTGQHRYKSCDTIQKPNLTRWSLPKYNNFGNK